MRNDALAHALEQNRDFGAAVNIRNFALLRKAAPKDIGEEPVESPSQHKRKYVLHVEKRQRDVEAGKPSCEAGNAQIRLGE